MNASSRWTSKRVAILAGAALVLVVVVVAMLFRGKESEQAAGGPLLDEVRQGPLEIAVSVPGAIKSREQEIIKNEVEGQSVILFIIPEGTLVKQGDLLVELDASKLQDLKIDQQIKVQNADAAFVRARENLEVVKNQAQADIAKAELDAQFAREDLQNYVEGEYKKLLMEAQNNITIANEDYERAKQKVEWSMKLSKQSYISQTELQADELAMKKASLNRDLAQESLRLLTNFTYKRKHAELNSNVEQTRLALERVKRKASADVVQAEADKMAKNSEFQRQQDQLAKVIKQIEKTKIYAPRSGLVVYASTGKRDADPLAEGQSSRERQDLIYLPTASSVMAEVKVHEASLQKVRAGLPVRISVDALPGQNFWGRVAKIALLPDANSFWMNPDMKLFTTEIHLEGDSTGLRTGMSCRAEIIVDRYDDALYVPVQSVIRVGGQPTVYVAKGQRVEPRVVELGLDNNVHVRVLRGLTPGERVLRAPPLDRAVASQDGMKEAGRLMPTSRPTEAMPVPAPTAQANSTDAEAAPGQSSARRADGSRRGGDGAGGGSSRMQNLTPEQREEIHKRIEAMTPEQREQMRPPRQRQREQSNAGGNGTP